MNKKLKELVEKYALEMKPEGEFFTLKSGEKSKYYVDCRNLHLTPTGLNCVVNAFMTKLNELSKTAHYTAIGGPSVGADPIIGGLVYSIGFGGSNNVRGFLVRKEEKEYGKGGRIIGPLRKTDNCVMIEDVMMTGASVISAIEAVEEFGCKVVQVYSVIDRMAGGSEALAAKGIPFESLLTIKDFGLE